MVQFYAAVVSYLSTMTEAREEGQGMVEYALILALISVVAIIALGVIGDGVLAALESVGEAF